MGFCSWVLAQISFFVSFWIAFLQHFVLIAKAKIFGPVGHAVTIPKGGPAREFVAWRHHGASSLVTRNGS